MNPDAFQASETADGGYLNEPKGIPSISRLGPDGMVMVAAGHEQVARYQAAGSDEKYLAGEEAIDRDMRLKRCGLVWCESQHDGTRWVAPPGETRPYIVKVLPLFAAKPTPGMEITATDGEKYILPKDFKGDWFDITSPKGVKLIQ